MRFGVSTDKGMLREINEDSYNIISGYAGIPVCFVIADGMGGHNSGEIASKAAVDFVSSYILENPEQFDREDVESILPEISSKANACVYAKSQENESDSGMGTTLIFAVIRNNRLYIGHIGDSRVYLLRDGELARLTTDHSYVEELIKSGSLTREEAEVHPRKNIITRALGCAEEVETDIHTLDIRYEDVFLLCTDGLTNMVREEEIKEVLEKTDDPDEACRILVAMANEKGGEDNITAIVFKSDRE